MPVARGIRWSSVLLFVLFVVGPASTASAQIRGSRPRAVEPNYGWWFSGGANAVVLNPIVDGKSGTRWDFGSDPMWQFRGTLEKALDQSSTLGIAAGYGVVDVHMTGEGVIAGAGETECRAVGCSAQTELWSLMGQFRSGSGGARGFQTMFTLAGGVNSFRNFHVKSSGDSIPFLGQPRTDLAGTLGGGVAYALGTGTVIELIQDFGIAWHSKEGLAEGQGRTYRSRTTRAGLRFHF